MRSLFSLLKPPVHAKKIEGKETIDKQYKYWRFRIFYSMYTGYVFYYFTRKSVTFAMPALIEDLGFSKGELGILASILAISYGFSKFISGILADRSNPRYFMGFGLIFTGICNILFGFSSSLWLFMVIWGINGLFQGWGWPPCARLLTHWYSQKERGQWWGAWSTAHSVGGLIIPIAVAYICDSKLGWRFSMFIPGVLCIGMGLFLINRLRDTPQSLGLPVIEEYKNDFPISKKELDTEEERPSVKDLLFHYVLSNKFIWGLTVSYFFVYIMRTAINDWSQLYLIESKNYSKFDAGICVGCFEVGGIFGSLAAGWLSDHYFAGKRTPINVFFCLGIVFAVALFYLCPYKSVILDSSLTFLIGFLIFGPQMLIGMATAELTHKKAAGTATGFIGWVAYLGAATAGWPLAKVAEKWGWEGFFILVGLCGVISTLALVPLWNVKAYSSPKAGKQKTATTS